MIVIEASAMVGVLVADPAIPELLALLVDQELHAPAFLDFEVASALRGHVFATTTPSQTPVTTTATCS